MIPLSETVKYLNIMGGCYDCERDCMKCFGKDERVKAMENSIIYELCEKYGDDGHLWAMLNMKRIDIIISRLKKLGRNKYTQSPNQENVVLMYGWGPKNIEIYNLEYELEHRRSWIYSYYENELEKDDNTKYYVIKLTQEIYEMYKRRCLTKSQYEQLMEK